MGDELDIETTPDGHQSASVARTEKFKIAGLVVALSTGGGFGGVKIAQAELSVAVDANKDRIEVVATVVTDLAKTIEDDRKARHARDEAVQRSLGRIEGLLESLTER